MSDALDELLESLESWAFGREQAHDCAQCSGDVDAYFAELDGRRVRIRRYVAALEADADATVSDLLDQCAVLRILARASRERAEQLYVRTESALVRAETAERERDEWITRSNTAAQRASVYQSEIARAQNSVTRQRERAADAERANAATKRERDELRAKLELVGAVLSAAGCDCYCDCGGGAGIEHEDDCGEQPCLGCRVDAAIEGK